mmetsp:Transcript_47266/g.94191  ORF Transcript_47266/g.94191 Transcript_47266/m.94191 type:complete len:355 (-) Transcript_47266:1258-2322(-)
MRVLRCVPMSMILILGLALADPESYLPRAAKPPLMQAVRVRANDMCATQDGLLVRLLVNKNVFGRDQRALMVRAFSFVHPREYIVTFLVLTLAVIAWWLQSVKRMGQCVPPQSCLFKIICQVGEQMCSTALAHSVRAFIAVAVLTVTVVSAAAAHALRGWLEEKKDAELTWEDRAAAASNAAYAEKSKRCDELRERGVKSFNWEMNTDLTTDKVTVFVNRHLRTVIIAYRGSVTLGDWKSNFVTIARGLDQQSKDFKSRHTIAQWARDNDYLFYRRILLTGHSRGGNFAELTGHQLGLPFITFNSFVVARVCLPMACSRAWRDTQLRCTLSALRHHFTIPFPQPCHHLKTHVYM